MECMKIFTILAAIALLASPAVAARQALNENASPSVKGGLNSNFQKANANFIETYAALDLKETKAVVQASAPADTTVDWYDTDQETGVLILKRHNGSTWLRASSHGVQYASNCASITAGMCVDTDDGKLYYHNGTAVVEVGTGGSGTTYTAGTGIDITSGVISSTVTGTLPSGTEGQGLQKGAAAWEAVNYAPLAFSGKVVRDTGTGLVSIVTDSSPTNGSANFLTSDAIYDALAGKEAADSTIVKVAEIDTQAEFEALVGWPLPSGGTGGYVALSAAPYSNVPCTTGQYGKYESTGYLCTDGFWTSKWTLTTHSLNAPSGNSDTFTTDGTLSASWADFNPNSKANTAQASGIAKATVTYAYNGARWSGSTSDISQIVIKGQTTASSVNHVAVRMGESSIGYAVAPITISGANWTQVQFKKIGASLGAAQTLASPVSWGEDHTYRLVASGTSPVTLSVYIDGSSTPVATVSDSSSPIASGNPGFYMYTGGLLTVAGIDDWQDY